MSENTPNFVESHSHSGKLPEGWHEAYYAERDFTHDNETYQLVKALYEHVPTALKVAVYPYESMPIGGKPTHRVKLVLPLYDRIGVYMFEHKATEIEWVLSSIIPCYDPEEQCDSDTDLFGTKSDYIRYHPTIEADFEWGRYPQNALSSLKTLKQYPLDYSFLLENYEGVNTAIWIEQLYPGLISQPIQSRIVIGENTSGEMEIQFADGSNIDNVVNLRSRIKRSKLNLTDYATGTVLAHVKLIIEQPEYGAIRIEDITFTEAGRDLMPLTTRVRQKVSNIVGRDEQ